MTSYIPRTRTDLQREYIETETASFLTEAKLALQDAFSLSRINFSELASLLQVTEARVHSVIYGEADLNLELFSRYMLAMGRTPCIGMGRAKRLPRRFNLHNTEQ